jgi:hypothetical protein
MKKIGKRSWGNVGVLMKLLTNFPPPPHSNVILNLLRAEEKLANLQITVPHSPIHLGPVMSMELCSVKRWKLEKLRISWETVHNK